MKMELIEGSETSAISFVTPGNYPKENILHTGQGESLKSSFNMYFFYSVGMYCIIHAITCRTTVN